LQATIDRISKESTAARGQPFKYKTIPQGAATSVWAGFVASAEEIGGRYCENCHVSQIVPEDKLLTTNSEGVRAYALDPKTAEELWRRSEELVGDHF
jgi:phytoene dehydrogenase-like protein